MVMNHALHEFDIRPGRLNFGQIRRLRHVMERGAAKHQVERQRDLALVARPPGTKYEEGRIPFGVRAASDPVLEIRNVDVARPPGVERTPTINRILIVKSDQAQRLWMRD